MKLEKGDHLIVNKGLYYHHGIYIGDGDIVHYSGLADGINAGPIEVTDIDTFSSGNDCVKREHKNAKYIGEEAVKRALSRLGENEYDIHGNNCEHFCNWVIYGKSESNQIEIVQDFLDVIVPNSIVLKIIKGRKHLKQKDTDITRDAAEAVAIGAVALVAAPALPVIAAIKLVKWLTK